MSFVTRVVLLLPFQSSFFLFLFFPNCLWEPPISMLRSSGGESGYHCLIPDLRGKAFSLSLSMTLAVSFSKILFTKLRMVSSIPKLLNVLIIKGYMILSSDFSVSLSWLYGFFWSFILLTCHTTLIAFWILNQRWILRINPPWSCYLIIFICYWIQSASTFWGFLYRYSQEILVCSFLFLVISLSGGSSFHSPRIRSKEWI